MVPEYETKNKETNHNVQAVNVTSFWILVLNASLIKNAPIPKMGIPIRKNNDMRPSLLIIKDSGPAALNTDEDTERPVKAATPENSNTMIQIREITLITGTKETLIN